MRILVKSGYTFYEEFAVYPFCVYFMNTLQPANDAEDGETKIQEGGMKPKLLITAQATIHYR
jgi:hypothetical protein